ncbi:organic hydroperoxide resistance protein [Ideonella sp. BN130291]|uniref:organic hydroperoxide resistance protein n=1 Tax=Ideonella sp. BN130291 TaxID=3112940 RepID=UPI002E255D6D|nr:organic hydroperoxide resistance protein [Ideonella sp. BN130291]
MALDKVLYTAHATSTGGRQGTSRSSDGVLDVQLATPKEMGGAGGAGTNPEQLFAAGYSACFIGAMKAVAPKLQLKVPNDVSIDAAVSFGPLAGGAVGYGIAVEMNIKVPGLSKEQAEQLVQAAHQVCPYSNATRGNIDVKLNIAA